MSQAPNAQAQAPDPEAQALEPRVRGESLYDQVSSFLMATVLGALIVVGWFFLIYATRDAYASRVTAPLEIVEVFGGGGGSPEGEVGSTEKIDVPGAEAAAQASNNESDAADFEEPSVEASPAAVVDAVESAGQSMAEVDLGAVMPSGTNQATGRRASKIGTGGPGFGFGPGDGGVPREQRWSIVYNPGQTLEEYARQLDALGVELATISGNTLNYAGRLSNPTPTRRSGTSAGENRLYFLWQGGSRKSSDVALLAKTGINVGEGAIFQFYPKAVEDKLAQLEVRYRGRQPIEIRRTRFNVIPADGGYDFVVQSQDALR